MSGRHRRPIIGSQAPDAILAQWAEDDPGLGDEVRRPWDDVLADMAGACPAGFSIIEPGQAHDMPEGDPDSLGAWLGLTGEEVNS